MPNHIRQSYVDARIGGHYGDPPDAPESTAPITDHDVLHLAELVPILRRRLGLDTTFSDDAVLASLRTIASRSSSRDRWRAAFDSNLGHWLAGQGRDVNTALNTLIALLPDPRM